MANTKFIAIIEVHENYILPKDSEGIIKSVLSSALEPFYGGLILQEVKEEVTDTPDKWPEHDCKDFKIVGSLLECKQCGKRQKSISA